MKVEFRSYLDQLHHAAHVLNIDLKEAIVASGLGDCTYYRWVNGQHTPSEDKARAVHQTLLFMGGLDGLAKGTNGEAQILHRGEDEATA